jgi:serine protease Do
MLRWTVLGLVAAGLAGVAGAPAGADSKDKRKELVRFHARGGARLGVSLEEVGRDDVGRLKLAEEKGARVTHVTEGSAAAKAGLKEDDVILRYHGEAVLSARQLARLVRETPPGREVALEVSRGGAVQRLTATLEEGKGHGLLTGEGFHFELPEMPEPPEPPDPPLAPRFSWDGDDTARTVLRDVIRMRSPRRLGIGYQELSGQLARYFKVDDGLLVTQVDEGSPAAQAGLQAGDVILKFDGDSIEDSGDLREALDEAKEEATVTVQRDGRPLDLKVKVRRVQQRRSRRSDL